MKTTKLSRHYHTVPHAAMFFCFYVLLEFSGCISLIVLLVLIDVLSHTLTNCPPLTYE